MSKPWMGQTVHIENEPHKVVDQKYGPMLTTIREGAHEYPLERTIKLKVKPVKGSAFWLPPMRACEPREGGGAEGSGQ